MKTKWLVLISIVVLLTPSLAHTADSQTAADMAQNFANPPDSARPWVYWFWLNGNITREGITADLTAMKRVGIGGVLIMEVDQGIPRGPVDFMSDKWRDLFKHAVSESKRLGLQINMNDDAGWDGSGGPWIKPEQAMQKLVWTETNVEDTAHQGASHHVDIALSQPETVAGYYRDIEVLAFPAVGSYRIPDIQGKAMFSRAFIPPDAVAAHVPADAVVSSPGIVDLTSKLNGAGKLSWDAPAGKWTILRIGHTCTGAVNAPSPESGRGLECDKLSKDGADANFAGMIAKLARDNSYGLGTTFVSTHVDSWENGMQNWTARMRDEFKSRRGYDPLPYLPVVTGRVVQSPEVSERFLWDLRQTISDLTVENYAGRLRELANRNHLRLSIEAYDGTCDDMTYGGRADEPMGEFWIGGGALQTLKEMSSTAHIYGKPIVGAETFTADDRERWQQYPASVKALGDQGFCDGINRFVFHRYAMQPWVGYAPGMTMGPWGTHYERTNTWWEWSKPWHQYVSRCQYMLRQGHFAADICYLQPEAAPQGFVAHTRRGYDFDNCTPEVVLTRMSVKAGRIVLPDGMNYRVLVLPDVKTMTPQLLRKVTELVAAGATVIGLRPQRSPGLPDCDAEIRQMASKLWGNCDGVRIKERAFGKGRIIWGYTPEEALARMGVPPDCAGTPQSEWIHRHTNDADIYFVANRSAVATETTCAFRVSSEQPELWNAETGRIVSAPMYEQRGGVTKLPIRLEASGSIFIVFRNPSRAADHFVRIERNGKVVWPRSGSQQRIAIVSAMWGPIGDTARTKDVTDQVRRKVALAGASFRVADLASEGDPALNIVKTLTVNYQVGSRNCTASATDPELITLDLPAEPIPTVTVRSNRDNSFTAEAMAPGSYRAKTANGRTVLFSAPAQSGALKITGSWQLKFEKPTSQATLNSLISWSDSDDPRIKYYSGDAIYTKIIHVPAQMLGLSRRIYLDLGRVEVMALVKLNGKELPMLWKTPFRLDITRAVRAGDNALEIKVVNLLPNRMIGDELLAEDSLRNTNGTLQSIPKWVLDGKPSPTDRQTFSTWRLWHKDDTLLPSGLIGPVRVIASNIVKLPI